ncbi:MAG: signal peptide peptidase SppA [Candidatus Nanoarchaeia archaeon]|jgi:protease-4
MNLGRVLSVFIILLSFAVLLGFTLGLIFQVPYGTIAVISITGEITTTGSGLLSSGTSLKTIESQLADIKANPIIQSVIIDINSGGGSSVGSAEIARAVSELGKPTVALIRDAGASGAYLIASACDYIVAHEYSIVGSIGVAMDYLEYSGLMERYNITYVNLSYPEHKDIMSSYRPLTDEEREWIINKLEMVYDSFVNKTAEYRGMNKTDFLTYANGSFFLGYEALEYGLIDELGGWPEALNKSIELGAVTEPIIIEHGSTYSMLDLLSGVTGKTSASIRT